MRPTSGTITRLLGELEVGEVRVGLVGLAVEDPLVGPEQVERGDDHAGGGDHRPPPRWATNVPRRIEELTDEAVEAGQADRRQHDHGEDAGEHGRRLLRGP